MPPNRHFTTTIANIAPRAACQSGIVAGRFSARRRPVTAEERSPMVCSFLQMRLNTNSESTAAAMQVSITIRLLNPNRITDATAAGSSAMSTSSMMERVVRGVNICGEEVTVNLLISFPPEVYSFLA